jgi:membrane associated rhomboid family serine protease
MIFAIIIMPEMEKSWRWSIPLGVLCGLCANCLAVLTMDDRLLGFSGVLTSYVGMIVLLLVSHFNYFQNRGQSSYCWIVIVMIAIPFIFPTSSGTMLIHLFGFIFGIILAAGFYPKHQECSITPTCDKIFKIIAVIIVVTVIVLAFII